jgi:hypothetical protein
MRTSNTAYVDIFIFRQLFHTFLVIANKNYGNSTEPRENAGKSVQVIKYEYTWKE